MRKIFSKIRWKIRKKTLSLYINLSNKLADLLPEEFNPHVAILPDKDGTDVVIIFVRIPHNLTRKLMWSFKAWKEN